MGGSVGVYPIPLAPFLTTVPASWLVLVLLYFIIRPQFEESPHMKLHFYRSLHVHNIFYVGGGFILLYTMIFRSAAKNQQRALAVLLPVSFNWQSAHRSNTLSWYSVSEQF